MRKLFIPTIGSAIVLAKDWTFKVINEHRNTSLVEWMGKLAPEESRRYSYPLGIDPTDRYKAAEVDLSCTLPKGTILKVDRIYIRKGLSQFDSVSFLMPSARVKAKQTTRTWKRIGISTPGNPSPVMETGSYIDKKPARGVRFFAKLDDVNTMQIR